MVRIEVARVRVVRSPSRIASSEITAPMDQFAEHRGRRSSWYGGMDTVLVEIGADGLDGGAPVGLAATQGGDAVAALLAGHLLPLALGVSLTSSDDIMRLYERLRLATLPYGSGGLAAMARSAIDIAVWDLFGKATATPVFELLGGTARSLPVYATGNEIEHHRALGFTASKVGLQSGPWHTAGARAAKDQIELARDRAGSDHVLMVDGWMGLDVAFIAEIAPTLRRAEVEWLEEPLQPDDLGGLREAARALGEVGLATGEHLTTRADLLSTANCGVRILQPDLAWCGGISEVRALVPHLPPHMEIAPHLSGTPWGVHVAAAFPQVRRVEWYVESEPGEPISAEKGPLTGGSIPQNGAIAPVDAPGLGLSTDMEFLDRWAESTRVCHAL